MSLTNNAILLKKHTVDSDITPDHETARLLASRSMRE